MRTTLTGLIHGESGVGKSWLADTAPAPRLILDLEGRAQYTPSGPKIAWVPPADPPVYDGSWQTCVATIADFDTLQWIYTWLRSGRHPFKSVVMDSLMEAQKRCIDAVAGVNMLDQQDWGTLLRRLESLVRSYRDLTLLPDNAECVLFIVGTKDSDGTKRPLLQGQLATTVPYYLDVVGYYYVAPVAGTDGQPVYQRSLLVHPQPGFVAKDGTGRLPGPVIPNPNIAQLMELLGNGNQPQPIAAATEGVAA